MAEVGTIYRIHHLFEKREETLLLNLLKANSGFQCGFGKNLMLEGSLEIPKPMNPF